METKVDLTPILPKRASQLLGLRFGNKLDDLLETGLIQKTLTYVYGKNANYLLNSLCGNSISLYGGHALFFDAGNCFDPYGIVRECNLKKNNSNVAEDILKSIHLSRVFTCHQLTNVVSLKLERLMETDPLVNIVLVSGMDSIFSEEDSSKEEIDNLQFLIASTLQRVANDKKNQIMYVVASSTKCCPVFLNNSAIAIKLYQEGKKNMALLTRHHAKQFAAIEL